MTQPPPNAPSDRNVPLDPETARVVLRMDSAISAYRAGEVSGLEALDSVSRMLGDLTDMMTTAAMPRGERRRIPRRPDRVELAILTALADTYGSEILTNVSLGYTLRLVARHGGVALVQRVLWGESASDKQLATMLGATRRAFEEIVIAFSDDLLAQAHEALAEFRPRQQGDSKPGEGGRG